MYVCVCVCVQELAQRKHDVRLFGISLSVSLSVSLSTSRARYKNLYLWGKTTFEILQNISNFLLARCCLSLSLSSWKKNGNNENKNSAGGTTFVAFKIVEKEEEFKQEFKKQKKTRMCQSRIF